MTGPGPLSGAMKSSPAGRAGIQAVSLFGPKSGVGVVCPAGPAASAGHNAAMPQRSAARETLPTASFRLFIAERLDTEASPGAAITQNILRWAGLKHEHLEITKQ